jgi:hypothetical protein
LLYILNIDGKGIDKNLLGVLGIVDYCDDRMGLIFKKSHKAHAHPQPNFQINHTKFTL